MRARDRREAETPEGESYYISMTDMMVGVVFIFILLLSFFALQYKATTVALTKASDPQTAALLETAKALQKKTIAAEVDYKQRVLCVPASTLIEGAAADGPATADDRRCFAFSPPKTSAAASAGPSSDERRSEVTSFVYADLEATRAPVHADTGGGVLSFSADDLFAPGSDALTPKGAGVVADVAKTLAGRLPCYGYSPDAANCPDQTKMAAVNVAGNTSFNAFSPEGRQAFDLALRRTVAFYNVLVADQPALGRIKAGPEPTAQPLLRVASGGQSSAASSAAAAQQSISIQFVMAP